ncbi:hypothetical protein HBH56_040710 [Parastagonospora nodorum]|uniref:Uncharacterized protein n=1 Tax=Phaeosphaeria nodorum (strain SN15 / ATCC MYA-4574 / FGSC 10173) TaxID=321614 RepID=A0A7U2HWK9_PHANO|nr:hypothetical protein HBH56_040710 [Parastagonospora nodorum]QRC93059.1 hypothetical protein JI435_403290 [Parastagonospora nodorum SN15]KAH3933215.1 hypothetical protein HBH54_068460 [Parastagonospora nodorum]KAH3961765.1 hypothetical protein HBH52_227820 [Parastagonospora nodorum]KAH4004510.1 hypothetical protein HBI10_047540 [Parastagonospora nodorum]
MHPANFRSNQDLQRSHLSVAYLGISVFCDPASCNRSTSMQMHFRGATCDLTARGNVGGAHRVTSGFSLQHLPIP